MHTIQLVVRTEEATNRPWNVVICPLFTAFLFADGAFHIDHANLHVLGTETASSCFPWHVEERRLLALWVLTRATPDIDHPRQSVFAT